MRTDRPLLKKAGNLRYAFARTSGEGIAIFDADFCPRPDFLKDTVPYLYNTNVGIVQTPQYFRYKKEQTWVEQGAGVTQEFFYRMVQVKLGVGCSRCEILLDGSFFWCSKRESMLAANVSGRYRVGTSEMKISVLT